MEETTHRPSECDIATITSAVEVQDARGVCEIFSEEDN